MPVHGGIVAQELLVSVREFGFFGRPDPRNSGNEFLMFLSDVSFLDVRGRRWSTRGSLNSCP